MIDYTEKQDAGKSDQTSGILLFNDIGNYPHFLYHKPSRGMRTPHRTLDPLQQFCLQYEICFSRIGVNLGKAKEYLLDRAFDLG